MKSLKILIVDDHALFSSGASELIQNHFQAEVDQISNPLDVFNRNYSEYDIILTDIDMPEMNGIELIRKIKNEYPNQSILVVSMHNKLSIINKCEELGVEGYIVKFDDNETFLEAIETINNGEKYYSREVQDMREENKVNQVFLTPREEEVIKLISLGHSAKEISATLFISPETVKSHYKNIRSKLNVKSRVKIIEYARDNLIL